MFEYIGRLRGNPSQEGKRKTQEEVVNQVHKHNTFISAADLQFKARARRGELAKGEPAAIVRKTGSNVGRGTAVSSGQPPKWQRLGYKSEQDGQDAGKMLLAIEARIGELLPSAEEAQTRTGLPKGSTVIPRVLGDTENKRNRNARIARIIASDEGKEAVEEVIREAEENEDIPTGKGIVKNGEV